MAAEDNPATAAATSLIPEFEERTGIKVEVEIFDETTLRQKAVLDFTSGTRTYDAVELQYWFVPEFAKAGYLLPLDDLLTGRPTEWLDPADFPGRSIDSMKYEGKLYGLPNRLIGGMYYYRKDIFAEHGWTVPTTMAEVMALSTTAKETLGDSMNTWCGRGSRDFSAFGSFGGIAAAYGARLLDADHKPTLTSDPNWRVALGDWLTLMRDHASSEAANMTWYDMYQQFMAGDCLQTIETTGYGELYEDPSESQVVGKVGYAAAPTGPAGKTAQWFFSGGYAINSDVDADQQGAAWLFLQWRSSASTLIKELTVPEVPRLGLPSVSVLSSPDFKAAAEEQGLGEYADGIRASLEDADPWYWPFVPEFSQISEVFATNVSAAIGGQATLDEALAKSNDAIEKIMTDAGY